MFKELIRHGVFEQSQEYGQISLRHFSLTGAGRKRKQPSPHSESLPNKQQRGERCCHFFMKRICGFYIDEDIYVYQVYWDNNFDDMAIPSVFFNHTLYLLGFFYFLYEFVVVGTQRKCNGVLYPAFFWNNQHWRQLNVTAVACWYWVEHYSW